MSLAPDLHAMLQFSLRQLAGELEPVVASSSKLDFATQAHLSECKSRIERMLSAELREREPFGFGSFMIMGQTTQGAAR